MKRNNVFLSRSRLEFLFKKSYNLGIKHFLKHIRIKQAQRILVETNSQIAEIASSVGYPDFRSFERAFKAEANETPLQYRIKSRLLVKMKH